MRSASLARGLLGACVLVATGCATGYHGRLFGLGFTDTQLAPDVFRVTFDGNALTSPARVQDLALLRAAEICLGSGFPFFAVLGEADTSKTASLSTPSTSQSNGTVVVSGNVATYRTTTTYNPGTTYNYYYPGVGLLVRGFSTKPDSIPTFDAGFLVRTLKAKYKIK